MAFDFSRRVVVICAAAALLAGCGGSRFTAPGAIPQSRATATRANGGGSWMLPEAKSEDLLYVSNLYTVTVYSYPKGKHVGTLKGFYIATGECVDPKGDVYVGNSDMELEYAHGGTRPVKTLTMSGYSAVDCSVDPGTGNLAVTWNKSASSTNYVAIYKNASGTPKVHTVKGAFLYYCGYDNKGNLFVDGQIGYQSQEVIFVELPSGSNKFRAIALNQGFEAVGPVQWDGKYVAVGDIGLNKVYRFALAGSTGTLRGAVTLGNAAIVYQWWIEGKNIVGPDRHYNTAWYWNYPAGGSPTQSITKDIFNPYGATVSKAAK